ncbi:MAG: hypothetical protein JWO57_3563 [Pseudonocardiales bacterium]|nr:hypothetical protein [Pseudonocardiales bacterium]
MRHALRPVLAALLLASSVVAVAAGPAPAAHAVTPSPYTAVTPTRILDTRSGTGAPKKPVAPRATVSLRVIGGVVPSAVSAVVLNVTATQPTGSGYLTVWAHGGSRPPVSALNFGRGQTVPNLVVAAVSTDGRVDLYNGSGGSVQLIADVSGYFRGTASTAQGTYTPTTPTRVLGPGKTVPANTATTFAVNANRSGVPVNASAVVVNLTVTGPTAVRGVATAYPYGGSMPATSNLNFTRGQTVADLAVIPVGAGGKISLYNASAGSAQLLADISGYFLAGDPVNGGGLGALTPARLLDTRTPGGGGALPGHSVRALSVVGRAGVPLSHVRAVVLNVTVTQPATGGFLTVYSGSTRPTASNLNFVRSQTVPNLVLAPVGNDGTVRFYNGSGGTVHVIADVSGYVLGAAAPLPAVTSTSRYVRNITGSATSDYTLMKAEGQADATAGSKLAVLDIGAQLNNGNGVALSVIDRQITYPQLVNAVQGYLDGFASVAGASGTVAVATNNGADNWTTYPAQQRGADWANQVVDPLVPAAGITVVGANDIEGAFFSTEQEAEQWEAAYLAAATTQKLIFIGSADGCPTTFGSTGQTCSFGWTQANYYTLAGGLDPSHIQALPQIYLGDQATQWANIDATGGTGISFAGALTEHAACPTATSPGCSFAPLKPSQGWAALYHAVSTVLTSPDLPVTSDLRVDS